MRTPAFALALLLAAPAFAQAANQPPLPTLMGPRNVTAMPAARPDHSFAYGEAEVQQAELFLPKRQGDGPVPVVVTVHGGCWSKENPGREQLRPAAAAFLAKGWAVWNIGYRRVDEDGGGFPGTYEDVAKAIDSLREHAEEHGLDLDRVILFGHSAGGHLALWAAGRGKLPADSPLKVENPLKPRAVVAVGAVADLKGFRQEIDMQCGPETLARLTGAENDSRADVFADTSPAALLPTGVPVVLLNGVYDPATYPYVALSHAIAARKAGDRAEVQIAPNAGHYEVVVPGTPAFAQALAAVARFAE